MSSPQQNPQIVRFGLFEVHLATCELRKRGHAIPLQDQPFQVLRLLVQCAGQIVTRVELQRAVWPADTFVAFDEGLNTAVKKIRQALDDAAENPRFIETVPRKGYRFIAPVSRDTDLKAAPPAPVRNRGPLWAAAILCVAAGSGGGWWFLHTTPNAEGVPVPVPLTSYPGNELSPSFSPDGNHVAFAWNSSESMGEGNFDIFVKLIGGGDPVRLTRDPADEFSPAWSPDGRYIAFLRTLSSTASGVFVIPAIGGVERKLAEIYQDDANRPYFAPYLSWSADGKWLIVGDKESPKAPFSLFRLSLETNEKQRLISSPERFFGDFNPAVSPDGGALVFNRCATDTICDLFLAELSKNFSAVSKPKPLTFDTSARSPAWTPEGQAIIFSAGPLHAPTLWKIALSQPGWRAGKPKRLAFAGEGAEEPTISRQGRLVYQQMSFDVDIWRAELNHGRPAAKPPTKLISSTRVEHEPRYSPDGKRVAFCSNRSGGLELWVCNSDGSNPVQLTSFGGSSYTGGPRWSPDGKLIVFSNTAHGKVQVYMISSEGGRPKPLGIEEQESWSRDGKWIYFASNRGGSHQLWKIPWPPTGHEREAIQVTKKGFDGPAAESYDGRFVYYLKGGSLWRSPLDGGEEARVLRSVLNDNFAVVPERIYFIPSSPPFSVRFLGFSNGKEVAILTLPREPAWGLSVSPDSRWLLYSEHEAIRSDLMLVENFR